MRLSGIEFITMNDPIRRFIQKHVEFTLFRKTGLAGACVDFLDIWCGTGYGAKLQSTLGFRAYIGGEP